MKKIKLEFTSRSADHITLIYSPASAGLFLDQHQPHPSTPSVAFTQQLVAFRTDFSKWLIYNGKVESGSESTDL